jgi:hypothetical protein
MTPTRRSVFGPAALADEVTQRPDQPMRPLAITFGVLPASRAPRDHFRKPDLLVFVPQLCDTGVKTPKLLFRFMM